MTDFCRPNYPTALIILVASITLKPYTHPATTIDKCPLSLPHESRDWTEGEPCSLRLQLPRSGFWVRLYSPVEQRESLDWQGHKTLQSCWLFEAGKWEFATAWACITPALHPLPRWSGEEFRHTVSLGLCQCRPQPTLCSSVLCGCSQFE